MPKLSHRDAPKLLMLSRCVPEALGDCERARSWQMMRLAGRDAEVYLACLHDGPVNLRQWRALQPHVRRTVIETRTLSAAVDLWSREHGFDAVLCGHPALWPLTAELGPATRICDMRAPASVLHERLAEGRLLLRRTWHRHQAARHRRIEQRVAGECDLLTTNHADHLHRLAATAGHPVVVADSVDLDRIALAHLDDDGLPLRDATGPTPALCLHTGLRDATARRLDDWFRQRIWPKVRRQAADARLVRVGPAASGIAATPTGRSSVVVCARRSPDQACLPLLQTMALGRPVIARDRVAADIGARHGEHLLAAQHDADWVRLCVESLRSASLRLHLARGARTFVEGFCASQDPQSLLRLCRSSQPVHQDLTDEFRLAA